MDLIRLLLLQLEGEEKVDLTNYDAYSITYHKYLIIEAKLAYGGVTYSDDKVFGAVLARLSWEGHEFLDSARNETGWRATMKRIAASVGTTSLPVVQALLIDYAKSAIQGTHQP